MPENKIVETVRKAVTIVIDAPDEKKPPAKKTAAAKTKSPGQKAGADQHKGD